MANWSNEIKDLDVLYTSFKGHLPDILKEMEQLIKTDDPNVVMLYSRRCLEVIITDLCECELKRPRKTEPLKGIIDKLNSEEKVPSYIITSMHSLNSMATYGAHPKDFDPEQVKPVLINLAIIIRWYLKYKDFQIVSKTTPEEIKTESRFQEPVSRETPKPRRWIKPVLIGLLTILVLFVSLRVVAIIRANREMERITSEVSVNKLPLSQITIGSQTWMAENLRTTKLNDGTPIPHVKDMKEWENLTTPAYCWYENDIINYGWEYGPLFNWYAVNTGKLCPVGWHVPSEKEWSELKRTIGDSIMWVKELGGAKLREAGMAHWKFQDSTAGTDEYGFKALPGGLRTIYGVFWGTGEQGAWWSSTEDNAKDAKNIELSYNYNNITEIQQYKQFGMSVRCVKDK